MSLNINNGMLLNAGFKSVQHFYVYNDNNINITFYRNFDNYNKRKWVCEVNSEFNNAKVDVQTVEQFNELMKIMNISLRLRDYNKPPYEIKITGNNWNEVYKFPGVCQILFNPGALDNKNKCIVDVIIYNKYFHIEKVM